LTKIYTLYEHITPNNKRYIGITSQEPNRRWQNGYGYTDNEYFMNAINKYGWDNIQHNILHTELTEKVACNLEKEYIKKYKANNREFGYNIAEGGQVVHNAKKRKGNKNHKSSRVHQIEKNTREIINTFESMNIAAKELGISRQGIGKACRGTESHKTYKGYIWEYADIDFKKPKSKPKGRPPKTAYKPVNLIDEKGNIIKRYESLQSAAEDTDCNYVGISKCCTGKLKTYHGRRWSYAAIP